MTKFMRLLAVIIPLALAACGPVDEAEQEAAEPAVASQTQAVIPWNPLDCIRTPSLCSADNCDLRCAKLTGPERSTCLQKCLSEYLGR